MVYGITDASGQFSYAFRLGESVNFSDVDVGVPIEARTAM